MAQECRKARHRTGPSRTEPLEPNSCSSKNSSGTLVKEFIREERGSRVHHENSEKTETFTTASRARTDIPFSLAHNHSLQVRTVVARGSEGPWDRCVIFLFFGVLFAIFGGQLCPLRRSRRFSCLFGVVYVAFV